CASRILVGKYTPEAVTRSRALIGAAASWRQVEKPPQQCSTRPGRQRVDLHSRREARAPGLRQPLVDLDVELEPIGWATEPERLVLVQVAGRQVPGAGWRI